MSYKFAGLTFLVTVMAFVSGCTEKDGGSASYYRGEYARLATNYTTLLNEQRTLIETSNALQVLAQKEHRALLALDVQLSQVSAKLDAFYAAVPLERAMTSAEDIAAARILGEALDAAKRAYELLVDVEVVIVAEQTARYNNAPHVFKDVTGNQASIRAQEKIFLERSKQLLGVRNLLATNLSQVKRYVNTLRVEGAKAAPPAMRAVPPLANDRRVELNPQDKEVQRSVGGNAGFARDTTGITTLKDRAAIVAHARRSGYNVQAAEDGNTLAEETGGVVTFAPSSKDIPKAVIDVVSHIKPQLNLNTDDLELALVIDYSGSMSDKIEATLKGLKDVVESLKNVVASGRNVRVALVTFGEAGKEKIELDFTRNMAVVQQQLDRLFKEYNDKTHSTDPGEASIHGLEIAAKKLSWTSKNRMAVAITDEPSQEIQLKQTDYVNGVYAELKKNGIQSRIYTIIVK